MDKRSGFGSVRKLPSGNYQARYIGPDLARHKAGVTFVNKTHAQAWLLEEQNLISRGVWEPPLVRARKAEAQALTVGEWVEQTITERETRTRGAMVATSGDLDRKDYRLRIKDGLGDVRLVDLAPAMVAKWWKGLPDTPTQNARAYSLLRSVMSDAVDAELIDKSPCRLKGAGKPAPKHVPIALSAEQLLVYFDALPAERRAPLMVAGLCGLRSGEVRGLRRCDVDLDAGVLHVNQAVSRIRARSGGDGWEWRIAPPKTRAGIRTVTMPGILIEALRDWLRDAPMNGREGLLFPARDGATPMDDAVLFRAHVVGREAVNEPTMTIHDLRKTAATMAAQGGATTAEVMRMLGHTTPQVAMVYQVATDSRDKDRAGRLDATIAQVQGRG